MTRKYPRPRDARSVALAVLTRLEESDAFIQFALDSESRKARLDRRDERLAWELTLGVERWRRRLDDALAQRIQRRFRKLDPMVHRILRLGAYQLLFLDRIPDRAAINTSAELGRSWVGEWSVKFINGVLRAIQRNGYTPPAEVSPEKMSISYSHHYLLWRLICC